MVRVETNTGVAIVKVTGDILKTSILTHKKRNDVILFPDSFVGVPLRPCYVFHFIYILPDIPRIKLLDTDASA